ncbi:PREDICTED: uncharacterized protein LOC105572170 [Cercocebus atys]|uniref:uncharacterized protein LOC105572170 n=1 Tax=Cercocebus atys TaxID=9531 RepID=UPI0005F538B4|nr:PREDICTED: uncharacterized protein LOC105572170 [Cercocebus atys]
MLDIQVGLGTALELPDHLSGHHRMECPDGASASCPGGTQAGTSKLSPGLAWPGPARTDEAMTFAHAVPQPCKNHLLEPSRGCLLRMGPVPFTPLSLCHTNPSSHLYVIFSETTRKPLGAQRPRLTRQLGKARHRGRSNLRRSCSDMEPQPGFLTPLLPYQADAQVEKLRPREVSGMSEAAQHRVRGRQGWAPQPPL